jgi:hypothetical protein
VTSIEHRYIPDSFAQLARTANKAYEAGYPKACKVYMMELSCHLLLDSAFDHVAEKRDESGH